MAKTGPVRFTQKELDDLRNAKVRLATEPAVAVEVSVQGKLVVFRGDDSTAMLRLDALIGLASRTLAQREPRRKVWRVRTRSGF